MRRHTAVWLLVGVAVVALIGYWIGSRPESSQVVSRIIASIRRPPPKPRELLGSVVVAYGGAETYQAEGRIITDTNMMGMRYEMEVPFKMAYQAPNLVYWEQGQGIQASKTVCDGENVYMEMGMFERVVKAPAPDDLKNLQHGTGGMGGFGAGAAPTVLDATELIQGEFDLEDVESIEAGFDQSNEWLVSLEQPEGTWVITVAIPHAPPMVLWIDRSTRVLRQVAMQMGSEDMTQMMEQAYEGMPEEMREEMPEGMEGMWGESMGKILGEEMGEKFGELMTEMMKDMEINTVIVCDRAVLGEPVSEGTFTYTPPEGAEVVEAKSVSEMHEALMKGFMEEMPWMPDWDKLEGTKDE